VSYLVVDGVWFRYGDEVAVADFSLSMGRGEFVVLVGPSGCGKTTVLRLVAGLLVPERGRILLEGRSIERLSPRARNVAMVFQNLALYPHLTVFGNLAFGLRARGQSRIEVRRKVARMAATLGIEKLLSRRPHQLSGGEAQRVALGRALVRQPSVFLLDEPLSDLDPPLRERLRAEILQLQRKIGVTTIYVTHDRAEALTIGSRIVVMSEGRIQQDGTAEELLTSPANLFVARFFWGKGCNLIRCETKGGQALLSACPKIGRRVRDLGLKDVVIAIGPEAVAISNGLGGVSARVVDTRRLDYGHETRVMWEDIELTIRQTASPPPAPPCQVHLQFFADRIVLFDPRTGALIK